MNTNENKTTNKSKPRHASRIRRRTRNQGSLCHPRKVTIRLTAKCSNELASIQGLLWRWGKRETMSELWEELLMPTLRDYVRPYAERARETRKAVGR